MLNNVFLTKIRRANSGNSYEATIPIKVIKYHGLVTGDVIRLELKEVVKGEEVDNKNGEELLD